MFASLFSGIKLYFLAFKTSSIHASLILSLQTLWRVYGLMISHYPEMDEGGLTIKKKAG